MKQRHTLIEVMVKVVFAIAVIILLKELITL